MLTPVTLFTSDFVHYQRAMGGGYCKYVQFHYKYGRAVTDDGVVIDALIVGTPIHLLVCDPSVSFRGLSYDCRDT